jgi:hypothetical protein
MEQPLERSGSAPPLSQDPIEEQGSKPATIRSASVITLPRSFGGDGDDDNDVGDIAGSTRELSMQSTSSLEMPSWDQPVASPSFISPASYTRDSGISPPVSAASSSKASTSSFGFNAWSTPSNSGMLPRAAPPARPHPAEFLANPFAAPSGESATEKKDGSGSGFGLGGWGRKTDDSWSGGGGKKSSTRLEEENPW